VANGESRRSAKKPALEPVVTSANGKANGKNHRTKQESNNGEIPKWAEGRMGYNPIPVELLQAGETG
jgi:hypothetical protein